VREDFSDLVKPNELEEALAMARASAPREVREPLSIERHDLEEKFTTHIAVLRLVTTNTRNRAVRGEC
jgi:hypothetical protein